MNNNKVVKKILEQDLKTLNSYINQTKENLDYLNIKDSNINGIILADKILNQDLKTMQFHLEQMKNNLGLLFNNNFNK